MDYIRIGNAVEFYISKGYTFINVPWVVDKDTMMLTCPDEYFVIDSDVGPLVGSAEQGFLSLTLNSDLPAGNYVGVTPCFRREKNDYWHQDYFMKVELFSTLNPSLETYQRLQRDAYEFFQTQTTGKLEINNLFDMRKGNFDDPNLFDVYFSDINLNNIEIGSYGMRRVSERNIEWCFGTGLAEPRFSRANTFKQD